MPPQFFPQFLIPSDPYGAYHIAADPFLFPNPSITLSPDQAALAAQFTGEAVGYSRTGNPTAPGTPLWTRFTRDRQDVMRLVPAGDSVLEPAAVISQQHHCDFWNAVTHEARH
jgi:para-nitrobenzyl esterase